MLLVFASHNKHKLRELKEMTQGSLLSEINSLFAYPSYPQPEETGKTFEENALIKAREARKYIKDTAILAEDSGLVVPAIDGQPGIFSANYAGEPRSDYRNRQKLLQTMKEFKGLHRQAYFHSSIALILPSGHEQCFTGLCEGLILIEEKGPNGFGYDPLFQPLDYGKSFGQLQEGVKNKISHRRKAMDKCLMFLERLPQIA